MPHGETKRLEQPEFLRTARREAGLVLLARHELGLRAPTVLREAPSPRSAGLPTLLPSDARVRA